MFTQVLMKLQSNSVITLVCVQDSNPRPCVPSERTSNWSIWVLSILPTGGSEVPSLHVG